MARRDRRHNGRRIRRREVRWLRQWTRLLGDELEDRRLLSVATSAWPNTSNQQVFDPPLAPYLEPAADGADLSIQLHHGTADGSVPLLFSELLRDDIEAAGGEVELFSYPGDDHNLSQSFNTAMARPVAFFDEVLK